MPKGTPRPPVFEVLESINTKSESVKAAADLLNERIREFAELLSKLPGRAECEFNGDHPDRYQTNAGDLRLYIAFQRKGKGWILSYTTWLDGHDDPSDGIDWKPLTDAPL